MATQITHRLRQAIGIPFRLRLIVPALPYPRRAKRPGQPGVPHREALLLVREYYLLFRNFAEDYPPDYLGKSEGKSENLIFVSHCHVNSYNAVFGDS